MTGRRDTPPTAAELHAWVQMADPPSARGVLVRRPTGGSVNRGWAVTGTPVIVPVPTEGPVRFAYRAPGCWRLESADRLVAVSDGRRAVGWVGGEQVVGEALLALGGPEELLLPGHGPTPTASVTGPHELLGRRCWEWGDGQDAWWVDEQTGILLRADDAGGSSVLTELELDVEVDDTQFALPADLPPVEPQPEWLAPTADLTVVWWPSGCGSYPVAGDPEVPEVLLALTTDGPDEWFLGVAPTGRPAPVHEGLGHRRWDGGGWSFALSHPTDMDPADVDRVVASVPPVWA